MKHLILLSSLALGACTGGHVFTPHNNEMGGGTLARSSLAASLSSPLAPVSSPRPESRPAHSSDTPAPSQPDTPAPVAPPTPGYDDEHEDEDEDHDRREDRKRDKDRDDEHHD